MRETRKALGPGCADIVGTQDLDHRSAHQPCHDGDLGQGQHGHRQDHVGQGAPIPATHRQGQFVAEQGDAVDAEDQCQNRRGDEGGNGDAQHGHSHHGIIFPAILFQSGADAQRRAQQKRQRHGRQSQPRADRQADADQLDHREVLVLVGWTQVAMRQLAQIDQILPGERLVEVISGLDIALDLGRQPALAVRRGRRARSAS